MDAACPRGGPGARTSAASAMDTHAAEASNSGAGVGQAKTTCARIEGQGIGGRRPCPASIRAHPLHGPCGDGSRPGADSFPHGSSSEQHPSSSAQHSAMLQGHMPQIAGTIASRSTRRRAPRVTSPILPRADPLRLPRHANTGAAPPPGASVLGIRAPGGEDRPTPYDPDARGLSRGPRQGASVRCVAGRAIRTTVARASRSTPGAR